MSDKTPLEEAREAYYQKLVRNFGEHHISDACIDDFDEGARWLARQLMKEVEWVDLPGLVTARVVREEDITRLIGEKGQDEAD